VDLGWPKPGLSLLGTQSTKQCGCWTGGPVSCRTGGRSVDRGWPKPGLSLLSTQSTEQYVPWSGPSEVSVDQVGGKCETWIWSQR
jgi:hypothetical protein